MHLTTCPLVVQQDLLEIPHLRMNKVSIKLVPFGKRVILFSFVECHVATGFCPLLFSSQDGLEEQSEGAGPCVESNRTRAAQRDPC